MIYDDLIGNPAVPDTLCDWIIFCCLVVPAVVLWLVTKLYGVDDE